ncbi:hypothetical protein C0J52_14690 [Blattella germanica]|nr:hypothetical protein C0J52_14690 [Blattella germanica]
MKVQISILIFNLFGMFGPAYLMERIDVVEKVNEGSDHNETSADSSTSSNATTYATEWTPSSNPEEMHRIVTPVVITSPQEDKPQPHKNFTASPQLSAIYDMDRFNHEHYLKIAQMQKNHNNNHHTSKEPKEEEKKHSYSQPLSPDLFLAQQYLKVQQQKEQEEYSTRNNNNNKFYPQPVHPQAKSNSHIFNSESISYKPLKFDTDYPTSSSSSEEGTGYDKKKHIPFQFSLPTPVKGNTHPYPYQNPYSSSEKDVGSSTLKVTSNPVAAKQFHGHSWADGFKAGVTQQEGEKTSMWKKVLNMLAAFIPLGLFLAALPPNVLTINTTTPDLPSRQRSVDQEDSSELDIMSFPILDLLDKYGIESLDDPECENRIFCEMSRLGREPTGNIIQKAFWHLAQDTPDKTADAMGMRELFKAVRTDACSIYRCKEKDKEVTLKPTKQKLKEVKE